MSQRQLKVLCCDACKVEELEGKDTAGWVTQKQTDDAHCLVVRANLYGPVIQKGDWCSIECYVETIRVALTARNAAVKPYAKTN